LSVVKILIATLLLLGVASIGYWLGNQRTTNTAPEIEKRVLYYRNPMGLPDTSPVPKKDAMGMDYVAVYEGEDTSSDQLIFSSAKVQKMGVKSEAVAMRKLDKTLRASGRIEIDERRLFTIAPKFEGWVERLYVNTTGQAVSKGQPLFEVYSPELAQALREQTLSKQGLAALADADEDTKRSMQRLLDAGTARLKNWDMSEAGGTTFRAPVSGIVLEKQAVQGKRFMPGEVLYQIADLSAVWVIADVPEQDIGQVKIGSRAHVTVDAFPEKMFDGKVDFIYPTLNSATRTVQVRMQIQNPKGLLKPAMFASAQIAAGKSDPVLTVSNSAVIDSGKRQVVLVRLAEGRFEPRAVMLGERSDEYVEVLAGIAEGEQVVTAANFLIDAESNLRAALGGMENPNPSQPPLVRGGADSVAHQARGTLEAINDDGTVSITHEPIPALKWPGMTMDFALTNSSLIAGFKPGSAISFEIVERGEGEWVITKLQAQ
jgi:RND family efflux transporter MFP subunit